jgi:hypothetical protein
MGVFNIGNQGKTNICNPSWITRQTMLRKEHFLFYEQTKPPGLSYAKKIKNEKSRVMRDGIVWLVRSPPQGIMSLRIIPAGSQTQIKGHCNSIIYDGFFILHTHLRTVLLLIHLRI